jgi:hypothetical protein
MGCEALGAFRECLDVQLVNSGKNRQESTQEAEIYYGICMEEGRHDNRSSVSRDDP